MYSILHIGVQYTAYWCTIFCLMLYSILYIGVQYTAYCCTVYCVLVYSILHICVQYTAYWCTLYCISSHCTALLAYFLVVLTKSKGIKCKTDFKLKAVFLKLMSSQFRYNFTVILLLPSGTVYKLHSTARYLTVLM